MQISHVPSVRNRQGQQRGPTLQAPNTSQQSSSVPATAVERGSPVLPEIAAHRHIQTVRRRSDQSVLQRPAPNIFLATTHRDGSPPARPLKIVLLWWWMADSGVSAHVHTTS